MILVVLGLLISIPIIVAGNQLILKLMDRFPAVITLGAMLLGWIAGTMAVGDMAISDHIAHLRGADYISGVLGALLVVACGRFLAGRAGRATG